MGFRPHTTGTEILGHSTLKPIDITGSYATMRNGQSTRRSTLGKAIIHSLRFEWWLLPFEVLRWLLCPRKYETLGFINSIFLY